MYLVLVNTLTQLHLYSLHLLTHKGEQITLTYLLITQVGYHIPLLTTLTSASASALALAAEVAALAAA